MYLTGPSSGPGLGPPAPLIPALDALVERGAALASAWGATFDVDPLRTLAMKAACGELTRAGRTSCGGASRLLPTNDGWIALSMPRSDDLELVPALIESEAATDPWRAVALWAANSASSAIVERAALLGLAVAELPRDAPSPQPLTAVMTPVEGHSVTVKRLHELVVVDLSALWAGPLCGAILADLGCTVIKVESTSRPDGARLGSSRFFDALNHRKRSVSLDFGSREGVAALRRLVLGADVVIEASRPRALRHLGLDSSQLTSVGPRLWIRITGHGATGADADRIAFGDDAAVAGGLVVDDGAGPWFCVDAIADPLTGLTAAVGTLDALGRGGRWQIDVVMSDIAARVGGRTLAVPGDVVALPPEPPASPLAPELGADTSWVMRRL